MATKKGPSSPYLKSVTNNVDELRAMLKLLAAREVLVGFPEDTTERTTDPDEPKGLTNASLGYIHDNGAPDANIPARPFMRPGMEEAIPQATATLAKIAKRVLAKSGKASVEQGFTELGLKVQFALRRKINEGVPPPLSEYTLRERARKGRKGAQKELDLRAQGVSPSTQFAKPLIDTGQLRNAINFVVRKRKARRK